MTTEIRDETHLEDLLSDPPPYVVDALGRLAGDLLILGVSGKMGPTLARMAVRASALAGVRRQVIGVARFSDPAVAESLRRHGVMTIACDLLNPAELDRLPDIKLPMEDIPWPPLDGKPKKERFKLLKPIPSFDPDAPPEPAAVAAAENRKKHGKKKGKHKHQD